MTFYSRKRGIVLIFDSVNRVYSLRRFISACFSRTIRSYVETGNDAFEWCTNQNHLRAAVERGRCVVCGDKSDKLRVVFAVIRVVFNDTLDISAAIRSLVPVTRMLRQTDRQDRQETLLRSFSQ